MSDLISRLKSMSTNINKCTDAEIQFLQNSSLSRVLDRAFNELYRIRPKNPVLFLSKWLTREARAIELSKKYYDDEQKRVRLENKFYEKEKLKQKEQAKKDEEKNMRLKDENNLVKEIEECKDFWLGFNHICQRLKVLSGATGCYLGIYDLKRRQVEPDDDETGHIDPSNTKVLRYIGWNDDHNFLEDQYLEQSQGVTFDLIFPPQKTQQQEGEGEANAQEKQANPPTTEKKEEIPKDKESELHSILIPDVVNESRMKFFREPRLGCYLALDLTYKTSLNYNSLLSAIKCTKEYEEAKSAQEKRKKEWSDQQEEIKAQINQIKEEIAKEEEAKRLLEEKAAEARAAQEAANHENNPGEENQGQGNNVSAEEKKDVSQINIQNQSMNKKGDQTQDQAQENPIEALEKQLTEWTEEEVKLADYDKDETKIFLCLDTLGQDRIFSNEEMTFIKMIGNTIKTSMEKLEQNLLEKDRDIRIKFLELEAKIKSQDKYSDEKSEDLINASLNQFYASDEYKSKGITEEDEKVFEGDLVKMKYLREAYLNGEFKEAVETFENFEFVEFEKIFQNLLYFCQENPLDINEDKTNKLEWKKAKKYWRNIFYYANNYNPLGPKPQQVKNIYKLNKIKENLESSISKRDEVKSYSQTLLMFIDFILHLIKVRHDDIIRRLCNVAIFKYKRDQIIKTNEEIAEERQKIIEEAKANNPNVRVPPQGGEKEIAKKEGEAEQKVEEEKKEEEKKEEEKKEEKKEEEKKEEEKKEEEKKEEGEQNNQNNEGQGNNEEAKEEEIDEKKKDEADSIKLAEQLMKFDEEHVKQEVPDDIEYDVDNDYDIDQNEKDTIINAALQALSNPPVTNEKKK